MNAVERLAAELAKGSNATDETIYLPVECIGRIMLIGMQMAREIHRLDHLNDQLREQVSAVLAERDALTPNSNSTTPTDA